MLLLRFPKQLQSTTNEGVEKVRLSDFRDLRSIAFMGGYIGQKCFSFRSLLFPSSSRAPKP